MQHCLNLWPTHTKVIIITLSIAVASYSGENMVTNLYVTQLTTCNSQLCALSKRDSSALAVPCIYITNAIPSLLAKHCRNLQKFMQYLQQLYSQLHKRSFNLTAMQPVSLTMAIVLKPNQYSQLACYATGSRCF